LEVSLSLHLPLGLGQIINQGFRKCGIPDFSHLYSNWLVLNNTKTHSELNDEALLLAYRQDRDNRWLGILLPRYTLLLLGVAMKYLKDKEQAQDAVQQVFLKTLTHLPTDEIKNFKGWLYVLMRNHCLQSLRDKHHRADESILERIADEHTENEIPVYTGEQLNAALAQLNEEQKVSVTLFYLKKLSYQQIAEQTGYSFAQVKSYIQNGKRNLKLILQSQKTK
jgi:RNA polymerase sigma factor (sigma-70 family)